MKGERGVPSWARAPERPGRHHLRIQKENAVVHLPVDRLAGYVLGRKKDCDIVCDDQTCSRLHACVAHHPCGAVFIVDLGSVHGTFVNGRELKPDGQAELIPGETEFKLGSCSWAFSLERGPTPSEASSRPTFAREAQRLSHHSSRQAEGPPPRDYREHREPRNYSDRDSKRRRQDDFSTAYPRHQERHMRHHERYNDRSGSRHERRAERSEEGGSRQSKFSDKDPASVVMGMANPQVHAAPMTLANQKRKLLWGNKSSSGAEDGNAEGGGAFGANRWDTAEFQNEADRQKFIKLMGVQSGGSEAPRKDDNLSFEREGVLTGDQQTKLLGDVENHFMQGLRRADGRKVGLGL